MSKSPYRKIAVKKIGRPLRKGEHVHHINGNHNDDRPENLDALTRREHSRQPRAMRPCDGGGDCPYSVAAAAEKLGVTPQTIRNYLYEGTLEAFPVIGKLILVTHESIMGLLAEK